MFKISFPKESINKDFTGVYLTVPFVNGVGETDVEFLADKLENKGLDVKVIKDKKPAADAKAPEAEPPAVTPEATPVAGADDKK